IRQLWMREAKQRVDEVRRGEVETVPAEETFAKVRQAIAR
ncbi:MAG: addiction module protein, partial [Planctomycetes bacterium]|nr:addiction module protein [Planctomycetota bacterium]